MKPIIVALAVSASLSFAQQTASAVPPAVQQSPTGWRVDKGHSSVTFSIAHLVVSEVIGRFRDFEITVNSLKDDFSDATLTGLLKVDSIDTGNPRRDRHLKADDFFDAAKFPEIRFQSTSIQKTGERTYSIYGNLTIRDSTKLVAVDAELKGVIRESRGTTAAWRATMKINRFDYGLNWNRTIESGGLVAGSEVTITLVVELTRPEA